MDDAAVRGAFEACSLTRDDWDHRAHLRVAWEYLRETRDVAAVVERMREGILRFDEATDPENLCNYHETMTRFWVHVLDAAMREASAAESFDELLVRRADLLNKRLILEYFSQPVIVSEESRERWVEPDVRPLPGP